MRLNTTIITRCKDDLKVAPKTLSKTAILPNQIRCMRFDAKELVIQQRISREIGSPFGKMQTKLNLRGPKIENDSRPENSRMANFVGDKEICKRAQKLASNWRLKLFAKFRSRGGRRSRRQTSNFEFCSCSFENVLESWKLYLNGLFESPSRSVFKPYLYSMFFFF